MRRSFSVSVFARRAGRVLLVKHARLGRWLPVGGEVEPGETPLEAARRELREETGFEASFPPVQALDGAPAGLLGYEEHPAGSKGTHLNFAFVADVAGDADVVSNGEFAEHRWVASAAEIAGLEAPENVRQLVAPLFEAPGPEALVAIANAWLAAFNARRLDDLLALYADDADHTSPKLRDREPETGGVIRGKPALRAWWQGAYARLPELEYRPLHVTAQGDRVWLAYERRVPGEVPMVVGELFVVRDGLIAASHVFHG